uniref:Uncharacterized protein n=1 Tax=Globodera rostochiensis TaxID=31243 RepID=A0A914GX24_GLORO
MELRLISHLFILLLFLEENALASLGLKKLFAFGHRAASDPPNGTKSSKVPFRRANSLQQRPLAGGGLSKPLMTTPLHAIELVNLLSTPDLYMDDAGGRSWTRIGPRDVERMRARGDNIGARIRRNIRNGVKEIGAQPVQALHDKAALLASSKSFDLSVLYSLLTLGDYLCDQLQLTSTEMREQIEKRSGFARKWFNKWPNVAELRGFDAGLGEKQRNLAKWATHLQKILEKAEIKVTPKDNLKEKFYDTIKVKRILKASDAKEFISVCDLEGDERMVKRKLQNIDLNKQSESATLSWASWATKQACKVQIGKKSSKMKEVKDLEGLDMQVCEGIKKGEDPNKIAQKMAPRLKKTVEEVDKSPAVQKELRKLSDEYPHQQQQMPKRRRRAKRAIWGGRKRKRGRGRKGTRKERLTVGMRSFMKLRPFVPHYLSGKPANLNARSPGARVRANRANPRRHKRGSAGHFITCTLFFLLALFFAINTISAFFAIFSPAFIVAIVATVVLGMITGVITSAFMGKCAGPAARMGAYVGGYANGHANGHGGGAFGGGGFGGHGFGDGFKAKLPKFGHGHSAYAMPPPGYPGFHGAPPEVYLLEEEYELKRERGGGFSSSASYSNSSSSSDENSGAGRSVERRKYRKSRRHKSYRESSNDDSEAGKRVVESEEEEKKVRRRTVTKYSSRRN